MRARVCVHLIVCLPSGQWGRGGVRSVLPQGRRVRNEPRGERLLRSCCSRAAATVLFVLCHLVVSFGTTCRKLIATHALF